MKIRTDVAMDIRDALKLREEVWSMYKANPCENNAWLVQRATNNVNETVEGYVIDNDEEFIDYMEDRNNI